MDLTKDSRIPRRILEYIKWIGENNNTNHVFSHRDEAWINSQIMFRFGIAYQYVTTGQWSKLRPTIKKNSINRWLFRNDTTYDRVHKAYGKWAKYRHDETAGQVVVYNLLSNKPSDIMLPIVMVDTMGTHDVPYWTYNRKVGSYEHVLWPLCSHMIEFSKGLEDKIEWHKKSDKLVFRGVTTGPLVSTKNNGIIKTSRFEIIEKWHQEDWADLGFNNIIESTKKHPDWNKLANRVLNLKKSRMSIQEMLNYKFILCIEGNDISTSFGWVLASNSVPIHPYPFVYEVWYFSDLQPWVHFIPCRPDGSDIGAIMQWAKSHDHICESIAKAGREYMKRMLDPVLYVEILRRMYAMWDLKKW